MDNSPRAIGVLLNGYRELAISLARSCIALTILLADIRTVFASAATGKDLFAPPPTSLLRPKDIECVTSGSSVSLSSFEGYGERRVGTLRRE